MSNERYNEEETLPTIPFGMRAGIFGASMTVVGIADLAAHLGVAGIVMGTIGAAALTKFSPALIDLVKEQLPDEMPNGLREVGRLLNRRAGDEGEEDEDDEDDGEEEEGEEEPVDSEGLAEFLEEWKQIQEEVALPVSRVTIEAIVSHVERNSYWIYIGRSLTHPNHQVEVLNFCRQHIKIIGRSQMGKSSMAAALMEIITRTHDPKHVQLALLDLEHKTSKLFADLPHVATWQGQKLHAKNEDEVIEQLGYLLDMLKSRYTLSEAEVEELPYLIIYIEEFLDLKNELKTRMKTLPKGEQQEAAARAYAQLVLTINKIALRGLKVHMQFLLCAQVDYADEDFKQALAQFGIGFSFCVRPTAAQAAGFFAHELLQQNAQANQKGQAVMEANGQEAIILAPDYDLRKRLVDLSREKDERWTPQRWGVDRASGASPVERRPTDSGRRLDVGGVEDFVLRDQPDDDFPPNVRALRKSLGAQPGERSDATPDERPTTGKVYRLNEDEIQHFITGYKACGSIDKTLNAMRKSMRYRDHARELVQAFNLRQDA
jgi:hypothetical protein